MSPELGLKPGAPDSPCNALSAQAPLWALSGGRGWLRGLSPAPQSVTSQQQAGQEWPGGAQGCICHRSLATWPEAAGKGVQSCSGWGEGPAPSLPWTLVLVCHPTRLLLQGWGRLGIRPPSAPPSTPALGSPAPGCPCCFASVEPSASSPSK